jgi:hypothetical protein
MEFEEEDEGSEERKVERCDLKAENPVSEVEFCEIDLPASEALSYCELIRSLVALDAVGFFCVDAWEEEEDGRGLPACEDAAAGEVDRSCCRRLSVLPFFAAAACRSLSAFAARLASTSSCSDSSFASSRVSNSVCFMMDVR